jgi:hypothetical protein
VVHAPDDEHEPGPQPRYAEQTRFGQPLVVSTLTLAVVVA